MDGLAMLVSQLIEPLTPQYRSIFTVYWPIEAVFVAVEVWYSKHFSIATQHSIPIYNLYVLSEL